MLFRRLLVSSSLVALLAIGCDTIERDADYVEPEFGEPGGVPDSSVVPEYGTPDTYDNIDDATMAPEERELSPSGAGTVPDYVEPEAGLDQNDVNAAETIRDLERRREIANPEIAEPNPATQPQIERGRFKSDDFESEPLIGDRDSFEGEAIEDAAVSEVPAKPE